MSRFVQLHLLTSYPPSNLNRDDLGRPKTAMMGGFNRLRISSQSLKRAWRTSELFKKNEELKEHIGNRTKKIGLKWVFPKLTDAGVDDTEAKKWSRDIQRVFGEPESKKGKNDEEKTKELLNKQLVHIAPVEEKILAGLVDDIAKFCCGESLKDDKLLKQVDKLQKSKEKKKEEKITKILREHILRKKHKAVDIALFGRMLADSPKYNTEAAAQVAHAITVHKVAVEDDFFTAVDDLNDGTEDMGAAHMGETEFAAGLFYLYICIDRNLLKENLSGDGELIKKTLAALTEAAAVIAPTGKQKSFASNARASYILCEKGDQQPRSLSVAFLKAVNANDMFEDSVKRLEDTRDKMDSAYGKCCDENCVMNAVTGKGSLKEIIDCVTS